MQPPLSVFIRVPPLQSPAREVWPLHQHTDAHLHHLTYSLTHVLVYPHTLPSIQCLYTHILTHKCTLTVSCMLTLTHFHIHTLVLIFTHSHTCTYTLMLTPTHSLILLYSRAHSCLHTHFHALTADSLSHTKTLMVTHTHPPVHTLHTGSLHPLMTMGTTLPFKS